MTDRTSASDTPTRYILLLQSLKSTPNRIADLLQSLPPETLEWRPNGVDWSAHMLVSHLLGAEAPFLTRLNRILAEDCPWLPYFGPEVARPETDEPLADLLDRFRTARGTLLDLLSTLSPDDWERPATHETQGPTTLALQVQNIVNHDAEHLGQLDELRRAWQSQVHV